MNTTSLGLVAALAVLSCASASADILAPLPDEQHGFALAARGTQIYECRVSADGAPPAWAFVAPEADLLDADGHTVGRHGAGPVWQARDGSRVTGAVKQRADAPVPGAVPWLLLVANGHGSSGLFGGVTSIRRVNTRGGSAPGGACQPIGRVLRVPYTADYHFFKSIGTNQP